MAGKRIIPVTQPSLPPLDEFIPYLEKIWDSRILTNGGPFHQQLEQALCDYLGVGKIALLANGTLALVTALQALQVTGEVITTPYSFVATANAILWNSNTPVFVDIDPRTCNLDPDKIEKAITPRTSAILAVHCYGNPAEVDKIQQIADVHELKVIYDAAHAFGVEYRGSSLLEHGDLSILSFHATKVFNTFEGGAIICPSPGIKDTIDTLKNFGITDELTVVAAGINGKMSEFNAAFGLLQLEYVDEMISARKAIDARYRQAFANLPGISPLDIPAATRRNASYFPIFVGPDYPLSRDKLYRLLKERGVNCRRYFFPLISELPIYRGYPGAEKENLVHSHAIADSVICLPLYPALMETEIETVIGIIEGAGYGISF